MLRDKKTKKKKSRGVPDRWLDYHPVGQRVPGTRFIAFKVPLKPSLNCRVSDSESFNVWDLLDHLQSRDLDLGLIIDLTFTDRYYNLKDVPQSISYIKIQTQGHHVPSNGTILGFKRAVRHFLSENHDNERLIGVHCTHGLNRTGYLVCRYLIDVDGLDAAAAVDLFNSSRGHCIERVNYLNDLQHGAKRSNATIDKSWEEPLRGLATERPPKKERPLLQDKRPPETEGLLDTAGAETSLQNATAREETRASGDDPAHETQPADVKRTPGNRRRRRGRHQRQAGQKACDRPPQSGLVPTPPLLSYVWSSTPHSSAPPPCLPHHSWSSALTNRKSEDSRDKPLRHKLSL